MLTNYFTLRSLVKEWQGEFPGSRIADIWSQDRGELTIAFVPQAEQDSGQSSAFKISVLFPLRFAYVNPSTARARRNVVSLFPEALGERIGEISMARNDRILTIHLESGRRFHIELFGPKANIFLLDKDDSVVNRFLKKGTQIGDLIAVQKETELPAGAGDLSERLSDTTGVLSKRLARVIPVFRGVIARELLNRVGLESDDTDTPNDEAINELHEAYLKILAELDAPEPRIYWRNNRAELLSTIPIDMESGFEPECFESVNDAVRVYVRAKLRQKAFDQKYDPLHKLVSSRLAKSRRSRDIMKTELAKKSRADIYEHYAHLLMSSQQAVPPRADAITVPDIVSGSNDPLTIPLRPELSRVQNAERYYERARQTRTAHEQSRVRLTSMNGLVAQLKSVLVELEEAVTLADVERLRKQHALFISSLSSQASGQEAAFPFRRYELGNGYEVWVGRNAAQNDRLTMREARKHDLWMHARGVAGSHTVLRVPRRNETPPAKIIETAASIAAYHSKARTSELAPVIVVERRYVRKPRKSPPGTVLVEREKVLIVRPKLPEQR